VDLGQQLAEAFQRRFGTGFERLGVEARGAVDLRLVAVGAPDQVRLQADEGIAAADRAALHRFQQEAVGTAVGQLHEGRNGGLQVGDDLRVDDLAAAFVMDRPEILEGRREAHGRVPMAGYCSR
jgi:hypothetical protein